MCTGKVLFHFGQTALISFRFGSLYGPCFIFVFKNDQDINASNLCFLRKSWLIDFISMSIVLYFIGFLLNLGIEFGYLQIGRGFAIDSFSPSMTLDILSYL